MFKRCIIALAVLGLLGVGLVAYVRKPKITPNRVSADYMVLRSHIGDYRQQTGDYPKSARDLAEQVGPRVSANGGPKLSYLGDDSVLLKGAEETMEFEYFYVSPDTAPVTTCTTR